MSDVGGDDGRVARVVANARALADDLARRSTAGSWTRDVTIHPEFRDTVTEPWRAATASSSVSEGTRRDLVIAVVCADLDDPAAAGRAARLGELHAASLRVEVLGPQWLRGDATPPPEGRPLPTSGFRCEGFSDFVAKAYAVSAHRRYDAVHVVGTEWPARVLGAFVARASDCPILVDDARTGGRVPAGPPLADEQFAVHTGADVELTAGRGLLVRDACSERFFDPGAVDRAAVRTAIGAADDELVVAAFASSDVAAAAEAVAKLDRRAVLHVIGDHSALSGDPTTVVHPDPTAETLVDLLAAADAVVQLDCAGDPAGAGLPPEVGMSLAMECAVIVRPSPALRDLHDHELLFADDAAEVADRLASLARSDDAGSGPARREAFLTEFSRPVNSARLRLAVELAARGHDETADPAVDGVVRRTVEAYAAARREERPDQSGHPDPGRADGADIVFFWKQNDTGIYGRRSDMVAKYFGADRRVRRVLHVNAPFSTERAARDAQLPFEDASDHERLSSLALLDRRLGIVEAGAVHHRTFLHTESGTRDPVTGELLPDPEGFADFVRSEMDALDMHATSAIAWVCPVVFEFLEVHRELGFGHVVCDVIDDQRMFDHPRPMIEELDRHYAGALRASARVFTNTESNVAAFADYASPIVVVPNGAETEAFDAVRAAVGEDDAPVIAYVGNMNDRIDWQLLDEVATARPDHRFVMVGAAHHDDEVHELVRRHENVELFGVVPYAQLPAFLQTVDVALVPHLSGPLTERMNPLKVYNYYAAGLPIVSTPIPNIDEVSASSSITIARTSEDFASAIDAGVAVRRAGTLALDEDLLDSISWSTRASAILDRLGADRLL